MGAYLSKPIFEPETVCDSGRGMAFGASSVQGWRLTQEDAHNCILDFDDDCSLFAVYDGHGGSEVSKYCSLYLPKFIKKLSSYQAGDCKEALIDAFVKFDQTLTKPEVIEVLKQLAQDVSDSDGCVDTDEDERAVLAREAKMPLEELIRSYQAHKEKDGTKKDETAEKKNGKLKEEEKDEDEKTEKIESGNSGITESTAASEGDHLEIAEGEKKEELSSEENSNGGPSAHGEGCSSKVAGKSAEESGAGSSSSAGSSTRILTAPTTGRAAQRRAAQRIKDKLNEVGDDDDDDDDDDEDSEDDEDEDEDEDDEDEDEDDEDEDEGDSDANEWSDNEYRGEDEAGNDEVFDSDVPGSGSGSTAVVALIKGDVLTVANAGDSRAVLCRDGKAMDLSVDHKPEDAPERARIERAGGRVTGDGRVNGGLNLSRAIGDHVYKQNEQLTLQEQMISPLPDVQTVLLDRAKDSFLVLACDGIWNCMTSQEVCDFVTACIRSGDHVGKICEQLFRKCIAPDTSGDGTGCDNMTCIIVRLNTESLQENTSTETTGTGHCNGAGSETSNNKRTSENDAPSKKPRVSS